MLPLLARTQHLTCRTAENPLNQCAVSLSLQVRVAACAALVAFVTSAGSSYCATNSGYLAAGVVLHMDDSDAAVADAACQVRAQEGGLGGCVFGGVWAL